MISSVEVEVMNFTMLGAFFLTAHLSCCTEPKEKHACSTDTYLIGKWRLRLRGDFLHEKVSWKDESPGWRGGNPWLGLGCRKPLNSVPGYRGKFRQVSNGPQCVPSEPESLSTSRSTLASLEKKEHICDWLGLSFKVELWTTRQLWSSLRQLWSTTDHSVQISLSRYLSLLLNFHIYMHGWWRKCIQFWWKCLYLHLFSTTNRTEAESCGRDTGLQCRVLHLVVISRTQNEPCLRVGHPVSHRRRR